MVHIPSIHTIQNTPSTRRKESIPASVEGRHVASVPQSGMRLLPSYTLPATMQHAIAPLRAWEVITFDTEMWAELRLATAAQLSCNVDQLNKLHEVENVRGSKPRKNRRRTTGQRCDVDGLERLVEAYEQFVCSVIAPHVASNWQGDACTEVIFQAMPSLRVATPSSKPAGQRHRDGAYGHQPGQINFWMPLSSAFGNNTLWLEPEAEGAGRSEPLEGEFGTLHRFHGHLLYHFTRPNDTPITRISLDFRVVPGPCYDDDWPGSRSPETGRQAFFVGGYYSRAVLDHSTQKWSVCKSSAQRTAGLRGNAGRRQKNMRRNSGAVVSEGLEGLEGVHGSEGLEQPEGSKGSEGSDAAGRDAQKDYSRVTEGAICVRPAWLERPLVDALRGEVLGLDRRGCMARSGVANAGVDGVYGRSDRRVCILPPFMEEADGVETAEVKSDARRIVEERLSALCLELRHRLNRPSLHCAECCTPRLRTQRDLMPIRLSH